MNSSTEGRRLLVLATALLVAGAGLRAQQPAPKDSGNAARTSHGWPVLDHLTALCGGRVYGADRSEISWEAFASPGAMDDVLAAYRSRLRDPAAERSGSGWLFRVSDSGLVARVLDIKPVPPPMLRPDCPAAPARTRTWVVFSRMTRLR